MTARDLERAHQLLRELEALAVRISEIRVELRGILDGKPPATVANIRDRFEGRRE